MNLLCEIFLQVCTKADNRIISRLWYSSSIGKVDCREKERYRKCGQMWRKTSSSSLKKQTQTHLVGGWDSSVSPPRSVAPSASLPLPPSLSPGLWLPPAPGTQRWIPLQSSVHHKHNTTTQCGWMLCTTHSLNLNRNKSVCGSIQVKKFWDTLGLLPSKSVLSEWSIAFTRVVMFLSLHVFTVFSGFI